MLPEMLTPDQSIPPPPIAKNIAKSWLDAHPGHSGIMNIMNDLRSFMGYLQHEASKTNGKVYSRGEIAASNILPIQHHILNLKPLGDSEAEQKAEALRGACTICMAEVRRLFGIMGVETGIHTSKLRARMEEQAGYWEQFTLLQAWIFAMGAMESRGEDRAYFFAELEKSRTKLGIGSWEELQEKFRQILWYGEVHDQIFVELCNGIEPVVVEDHLLAGNRFGGYRPLLL